MTKSEVRMTNQIRTPNVRMTETDAPVPGPLSTSSFGLRSFGHWFVIRHSDLIRISNFVILIYTWDLALGHWDFQAAQRAPYGH